jgi:hypothetical protein
VAQTGNFIAGLRQMPRNVTTDEAMRTGNESL